MSEALLRDIADYCRNAGIARIDLRALGGK
jgi:hypothetical protein